MSDLLTAVGDVRDRLLLAMAALVEGDESKASEELEHAATRLRAAIAEMRA